MTKRELIELTTLEAFCVGGAVAFLSTLTGLLVEFDARALAGTAIGLGVAAAALAVAFRPSEFPYTNESDSY